MEEYKVGEVFQFGKIKLKCVESIDTDCRGCVLSETSHCRKFMSHCHKFHRSDEKDVIFIEVKEEKNGSISNRGRQERLKETSQGCHTA